MQDVRTVRLGLGFDWGRWRKWRGRGGGEEVGRLGLPFFLLRVEREGEGRGDFFSLFLIWIELD